MIEATVSKWGNSLALRIPRSIAAQIPQIFYKMSPFVTFCQVKGAHEVSGC